MARDYRELPGAAGTLFSLLPPENASGNYVKVVQRFPVRIHFNPNQGPEAHVATGACQWGLR
jgi:membrane fusion protein, multidrug efflux system